MKIELDVSEENEGTSYPWWMIVDPDCAPTLYGIAIGGVTGPFFSRESAQEFLDKTRYNFSSSARVWCASGTYSREWVNACDKAKKVADRPPV